MKLYYVYTQKMCAELMLKGYKLLSVEPSQKREGYNVFIFRDSERLRNEVKELMIASKK